MLFALSSVLEVFATRERVGFLSLGWLGWLGCLAVGGVLRGAWPMVATIATNRIL